MEHKEDIGKSMIQCLVERAAFLTNGFCDTVINNIYQNGSLNSSPVNAEVPQGVICYSLYAFVNFPLW